MEFDFEKDAYFELRDDIIVERFLLFLGIRENLEFEKNDRGNFISYFVNDHPSHWLIFMRFRGHQDPDDNGFLAECLPKSKVTFEEACSYHDKNAQERTEGNIHRFRRWGTPPAASN